MELHIFPERTVAELQHEFAEAFPGLKLVFFTKPHPAHTGSAAKFMVQDNSLKLKDIASHIKTGYLIVELNTAVWQLERLLESEYGLHAQVFRKSGQTWLETSVSDDLTLEQQQAKVHAAEHVHQEFADPMDYREQD